MKPQNHWFLELDFNANELRVLIALNGEKQPEGDVHEWNIKNVFRGIGTRDKAKKRLFAWLYNPDSDDHLLSRFYDKEKILSEYYKDGKITTPFDRTIDADDFHALNYLIQSTTADLVMERAVALDKFLEDKKSFVSHIVHDEIVIDLADEERVLVPEIKDIFANNKLDKFLVNLSCGKNYVELKELQL